MPDARRLVVHIGLEKTGTSSLQACLHRNGAILRRHSVLYPKRNPAYGWENHKPLVGCYAIDEGGDKWLAVDPSRRRATVAALIREIEAARERTAVISAEHFSSRFRAAQIDELRADFARFDCRVVIVIRDHFSRLCSSYDTYVTNGGTLPLGAYADGMMRPGAPDLRYAELIAPWAAAFGRDRVDLIAYGPDVNAKILGLLAPGLAAEPGLGTYRLRVSAGADVMSALRLANLVAAQHAPADSAAWALATQRRAQVKAWLLEAVRGEPSLGWSLDAERLARLTEIAREDAASLEAGYGFVLESQAPAPASEGAEDGRVAELLARALVARAAGPWTKASLIGAGHAAAVTLRDKVARLRRKVAGSPRAATSPTSGSCEISRTKAQDPRLALGAEGPRGVT